MANIQDYEIEKSNELRIETQKFSIKIYIAILSIGWVGTCVSILRSLILTGSEITHNLIVISLAAASATMLLIFSYYYGKNLDVVDWILLAITLGLYFVLFSISKNNKIVNLSIWFPMFIILVLGVLSRNFIKQINTYKEQIFSNYKN